MKVVFIKDLEGQAERGETKQVKPGYARNFLLAYGFAVLLTDPVGKSTVKQIEKEKAEAAAELEKLRDKVAELQELTLKFSRKKTTKGGLFSAVKEADILKEFEKATGIKEAKIKLDSPIKELGKYSVEISLPHELSVFVTVEIKEEKAK